MSKFNAKLPTATTAPIIVTAKPKQVGVKTKNTKTEVVSYEGGESFLKGDKLALFTLAGTYQGGDDTYYESGESRTKRLVELTGKITKTDPEWVAGFAVYLREKLLQRSASIIVAAEYVRAGGPNGRKVVKGVMARADEPAELISYWKVTGGAFRKEGQTTITREEKTPRGRVKTKARVSTPLMGVRLPKPIQRGIADAVSDPIKPIYTQRAALKPEYDSEEKQVRFGDVLELTHPKGNGKQDELFKYLIDRRKDHVDLSKYPNLHTIQKNREMMSMPPAERQSWWDSLGPEAATKQLGDAGVDWRQLAGWLGRPFSGKDWDALIPTMGAFAIVRNMANFEKANISSESAEFIRAKLLDENEIRAAKLYPIMYWQAYQQNTTERFRDVLEQSLDLSVSNIPELEGETIILVDVSGSMNRPLGKSKLNNWEFGALFGIATYLKSKGNAKLVFFGSTSEEIKLTTNRGMLTGMKNMKPIVDSGRLGWGTNAYQALQKHHEPGMHRAVFFTDEQIHPGDTKVADSLPVIYTFDLGGYETSMTNANKKGRYKLGGFSDATFELMAALEKGESTGWPWES